jgi:hypothetical protein
MSDFEKTGWPYDDELNEALGSPMNVSRETFNPAQYNELARVDFTGYTDVIEVKNKRTGKVTNLTYVKWGRMVKELNRIFGPQNWKRRFTERIAFGGVEVTCNLWIGDQCRTVSLSCMDYHNNPIPSDQVTLRDLHDTQQRCSVKAAAEWGLGLQVYINGNPKPEDAVDQALVDALWETLNNDDADLAYAALMYHYGTDTTVYQEMMDQFAKPFGTITAMRKKAREKSDRGHAAAQKTADLMAEHSDPSAVVEIWQEMTKLEKALVWAKVPEDCRDSLKETISQNS